MQDLYNQIKDQLDPEYRESMKRKGEAFFREMDLDRPELTDLDATPFPLSHVPKGVGGKTQVPLGTVEMVENKEEQDEAFLQLEEMILSGMHPSYLKKNERDFMEHVGGKHWFKKYGYLEMDVNRVNL